MDFSLRMPCKSAKIRSNINAPVDAGHIPGASQHTGVVDGMNSSAFWPPADGYVYVLRAGEHIKIGRSRAVSKRIRTLKIQLPFPAVVEAIIPCENMVASESYLHWLFRKLRVNGEWFSVADDAHLLPFLKEIAYMGCVKDNGEEYVRDYCLDEIL